MSDLVTDQIGSLIRRLFQTINWKVSEIVLLIFNHKHAGSFGALAGFAIAVIFTWKFLKPAPGRQRRNRPKRRVPQSAAGGGEGSGVGSSSLDFSLEASLKDLVVVESPVELNHWQITRRKLNGARKMTCQLLGVILVERSPEELQVPPMPSNGLEPAAPVADKGDAESSKQGKSQQRKRKDDQGADLETKEERILEGGEEPNQAMVCTICNVVVNSRTVYDSHITGSKHAAMAKKQQEAAAPVADKGDDGSSKQRKKKEAHCADLETKTKRIFEGADPNQVMVCTCNLIVNSQTVYDSHITGLKHTAMVKKQQEATTPVADKRDSGSSKQRMTKEAQGADLETKKKRILEGGADPNQVMVCTICNVVVNSQTVYGSHITGSKHAAMVKKQQEAAAPVADKGDTESSKQRKMKEAQGTDLETKKKRILEGGADPNQVMLCTICNVVVNSETVYVLHLTGSKHAAMVKKQQDAAAPVAGKGDAGSSKQRKRKEVQGADLETKMKRILEGGVDPSQVMVCTICNVIVNSQTVYDSHITGLKHAAMAKKQQETAAPVADKGVAESNKQRKRSNKQRKRKKVQCADLETKMKRILEGGADPNQVMVCTICDVVVNSRIVYDSHITGSKHVAMVKKPQEAAAPVADKGDAGISKQRKRKEAQGADLETKMIRILEGGADPNQVMMCAICNVVVNSQTVYDSHITGSKHAVMAKQQQVAATPVADKGDAGCSKSRKRKEAQDADLETKVKRILEGGADPNQVMICTICSVVVNNRTVYDLHITGSKHAAVVKKLREAAVPVADKGDSVCSKQRKRKEAQGADLETKKMRILGGGADPNQVMVCTICNVVVNSQTVYDSHINGSKHAAMVKKQQEAAAPVAGKGDAGSSKQRMTKEAQGADLETKKMRILGGGADPNQVMVCTICNVVVNSQTVYGSHINGSKHAAMVKKQQEAAAPVAGKGDAGSSKQRMTKEAQGADLETKKKRILEGGADPNQVMVCTICNVVVNSWTVYDSHITGSKHAAMAKKQQEAAAPVADKGDAGCSKNRKRKEAQGADLETKMKRILEGGADPNQVMMCTICTVVVNNRTVYNSHITGSKHAAMVKKQQEAAAPVAEKGDAGSIKPKKRKEA